MAAMFKVIIPARLGSTRLPGKMLLDIAGKPLIQHVYEAAKHSLAQEVLIATDDRKIQAAGAGFGANCIMTSATHQSGTDRLAEVAAALGWPDDTVVVNVQGDEIGLPAELINQTANLLMGHPEADMATLCEVITTAEDINNPNIVKVVFGSNKRALYFSRAAIPWHKADQPRQHFRHIGIYGYRAGFLKTFSALPRCELEQKESLEQLRALDYGATVLIEEASVAPGLGIDTEADLLKARQLFK